MTRREDGHVEEAVLERGPWRQLELDGQSSSPDDPGIGQKDHRGLDLDLLVVRYDPVARTAGRDHVLQAAHQIRQYTQSALELGRGASHYLRVEPHPGDQREVFVSDAAQVDPLLDTFHGHPDAVFQRDGHAEVQSQLVARAERQKRHRHPAARGTTEGQRDRAVTAGGHDRLATRLDAGADNPQAVLDAGGLDDVERNAVRCHRTGDAAAQHVRLPSCRIGVQENEIALRVRYRVTRSHVAQAP